MRTFNLPRFCVLAALIGALPASLGAQERPPIFQPPEPALHNLTADEKLAAVQDIMSWVPVRELADDGSTDDKACRAMAEDIAAGGNVKFLEPDALGATARPDDLRTIEGQCPALILDETTVPKIGRTRATRNFSIYVLQRPINGIAASVFYAERWCAERAKAGAPCPAPGTVKAFDLNSCTIFNTETLPPRVANTAQPSSYVQGVMEYLGEYYIANVGDACPLDQAKKLKKYTFEISSVQPGADKSPKVRCRLSANANVRCPSSK
ncbi:MAG: hypothetical protein ACYCZX_01115 [Rhodospirillaceae bacterium]